MSAEVELPDGLDIAFIEQLYADYRADPTTLSGDWCRIFEAIARGENGSVRVKPGPSFQPESVFGGHERRTVVGTAESSLESYTLQDRVDQLVRAYRVRGHMSARLDPLRPSGPRAFPKELDPAFYGFTGKDLSRSFSARTIGGPRVCTLKAILTRLRNTYCRSIGVQFMHIDDLDIRHWLQERMEGSENRPDLHQDEQVHILNLLTDAVVFEEFIQKKYVGAKSFSLEGAESLIPLLDMAIERAGRQGIERIVLTMAHRGRLNVLANIMGKSPKAIFMEFEGRTPGVSSGDGDVKYHLGYTHERIAADGHRVHLSLCFNPSHLEYVNPVALGRVRARQDRTGDAERRRSMALLIHGDAAFAGEGIVQETLNLSDLKAYNTGGSLHVIVNNQIGFTTGPREGRSSIYASAVAKMLQIPIFHVNGEDPEAVAQVLQLSMDFRRDFQRDVVIDMWCYRRHGHNESDEPSFTQPLLYRAIEQARPTRERYLAHLRKLDEVTQEESDEIEKQSRQRLEKALEEARHEERMTPPKAGRGIWDGYFAGSGPRSETVRTTVEKARLSHLLDSQTRWPRDFHPHSKIRRWLERRRKMAQGEIPLDWSAGEALAFASLATTGFRIRMSGQDTARGTFSQRHAVLHDVKDGHAFVPLQHLSSRQAPVEILNSPLSEAGVLGFEYGYSLDCPDGLILWEAQFGDFCNAAQVMIDQFIVSGEDKWERWSGLVLLLPHGFEGQGQEHSSARLERFLSLAAQENIQIAFPTTPAQYFHLLRRQVLCRRRKPLVVLTPKSLLRHPQATSDLDTLAEGAFQQVIPDDRVHDGPPKRVLLCSGKIYYELVARREEQSRGDVSIVRVEQLYPLYDETLSDALPYPDNTPVYWVQEEPRNMGAWPAMRIRYGSRLLGRFPFESISRPASASPAVGLKTRHRRQQDRILEVAFSDTPEAD